MKQAQPYRKSGSRRQTPALRAMQRGRSPLLRSIHENRRQAMRKKKQRRGMLIINEQTLLTKPVWGTIGWGGGKAKKKRRKNRTPQDKILTVRKGL